LSTFVVFFIAGLSAAGFVTIWFTTVHKELSVKRNSLTDLEDQLRLHKLLSSQARYGPDEQSAVNIMETSRMLCREASKSYNRILNKPMNRIPALLMGFRIVDEEYKQGNGLKVNQKFKGGTYR
jgi:hypothetical protein